MMTKTEEHGILKDLIETVGKDLVGTRLCKRYYDLDLQLVPAYSFRNDPDTGIYRLPSSSGAITITIMGAGGSGGVAGVGSGGGIPVGSTWMINGGGGASVGKMI